MPNAFRLALILVLVLTGQTLAAARGQGPVAGEMVLCLGEIAMTVTVDAEGNPVKRVTICPEMAPSLMQAVASGAGLALPLGSCHALDPVERAACVAERAPVTAQARDPPFPSVL